MPNKPASIEGKTSQTAVRQELEETAELHWWKTADGAEHPVRVWTAASQKAVVVYFHGIESHGRWFEDSALELNKNGVTVFAFDRRGAGSSREMRGHVLSWRQWVDDADEILAQVRRINPTSPIFVVANCWGSKVALAAVSRPHNNFVRGIAITSPAVCVKVDLPIARKLQVGLSLLRGGKDYFDIPLTPEHFTDVPLYLDYVRRDPLRLTRATASFFFESIKLTRECKASARKLQMPILILQAGRDAIVNVDKIKQWFNTLPLRDKQLRMFDHAAHSLDFDPCATEYQKALADWILERACK